MLSSISTNFWFHQTLPAAPPVLSLGIKEEKATMRSNGIIVQSQNNKKIRKLGKIADQIESYGSGLITLKDEYLKSEIKVLKNRLVEGESLDNILVEAFAVCIEAVWRTLGIKMVREQLIGAVAIHQGMIAEIKNGEDRILTAVLPAFLNALEGNGVHVVTFNDYLTKRDFARMEELYGFLGLTVGSVTNDVERPDRHKQYMADITYGTYAELCFDYLCDKRAANGAEHIQRELNYAIIDHADSILIDDAEPPLLYYFRKYQKLAGMTETAKTGEEQFREMYGKDVVVIPESRPVKRKDFEDLIFAGKKAKYDAIAEAVTEYHSRKQPVLIGTVSIEASEHISIILTERGIMHSVVYSKDLEKEANVIANAGREGAVTIVTNLAGRGIDIFLGGNPETETGRERIYEQNRVVVLGGLAVIGAERHESKRLDDQLRKRSGLRGDPGETRFYISLEDDFIRKYGSTRLQRIIKKTDPNQKTPIISHRLHREIDAAQLKAEDNSALICKQKMKCYAGQ